MPPCGVGYIHIPPCRAAFWIYSPGRDMYISRPAGRNMDISRPAGRHSGLLFILYSSRNLPYCVRFSMTPSPLQCGHHIWKPPKVELRPELLSLTCLRRCERLGGGAKCSSISFSDIPRVSGRKATAAAESAKAAYRK